MSSSLDTGFFARDSVRFAHYELAAMLALIIHIVEKSKDRATKFLFRAHLQIPILLRSNRLGSTLAAAKKECKVSVSEVSDWFSPT